MDDTAEQQFEGKAMQIARISQPIPGGMDHAFDKCALPYDLWDTIIQHYTGSLSDIALVCKKFNYLLGKYRYDFRDFYFSNADFDSVMKNPCVLSLRLSSQSIGKNIINILSQKNKLLYISLDSTSTDQFTDEISLPTNLRYLCCHLNVLWNLNGLSNLTYLDLSFNETPTILNFSEHKLTNLTHLNLSNYGMGKPTSFSFSNEGIGTLSNLTFLDLSFLGLTSIVPQQFLGLTKLEKLNLENTYYGSYLFIKYCINEVSLKRLTNLTWLNLANDKIMFGRTIMFGGTRNSFSGEMDDEGIVLDQLEFLKCNFDVVDRFKGSPRLKNLKKLHLELPYGEPLRPRYITKFCSVLKDICQLINLTELNFRPISNRESYNNMLYFYTWKRNAFPIILALWPHNLRIINGYNLPEKTLLNRMHFQAARDIIEKEYEIEGIIRRDLKFREYRDGEEIIGAVTPIIFAGMIAVAIGGIYCIANYVNNK